jgi:hypothetical protein
VIVLTCAAADFFASGGSLVVVELYAECAWLTTVGIGFTDLTKAGDAGFLGVERLAVVVDADLSLATIYSGVAFDHGY